MALQMVCLSACTLPPPCSPAFIRAALISIKALDGSQLSTLAGAAAAFAVCWAGCVPRIDLPPGCSARAAAVLYRVCFVFPCALQMLISLLSTLAR